MKVIHIKLYVMIFDLDKCDNMNAMIRVMYEVLKVC
jgi:hypothetical protein